MGNAKAIAIRKVKGITIHQYLTFSLIASGIYHTKKVRTTTVRSAPNDFPA